MLQFPQARGKPAANLTEGMGLAQLAKKHGNELIPAGEPLGGVLGAMLLDQCGKLGPGKMLEQLIEQTGYLYDCLALLVGDVWRRSGQGTLRQRSL